METFSHKSIANNLYIILNYSKINTNSCCTVNSKLLEDICPSIVCGILWIMNNPGQKSEWLRIIYNKNIKHRKAYLLYLIKQLLNIAGSIIVNLFYSILTVSSCWIMLL